MGARGRISAILKFFMPQNHSALWVRLPALPSCVSGCTGSAGSCDTGESPSLSWSLLEIGAHHNSRKILLRDVDRFDTAAKKGGWGPIKMQQQLVVVG